MQKPPAFLLLSGLHFVLTYPTQESGEIRWKQDRNYDNLHIFGKSIQVPLISGCGLNFSLCSASRALLPLSEVPVSGMGSFDFSLKIMEACIAILLCISFLAKLKTLFIYLFVAVLWLRDLSSLSRDQTCALCSESRVRKWLNHQGIPSTPQQISI